MGDLNVQLGSDDTLSAQSIGKHGPSDRNKNGGRFFERRSYQSSIGLQLKDTVRTIGLTIRV